MFLDKIFTLIVGRSRNVWESPAGCLLFSFTLQMDDGRILPLLQYVVSLAVVEALKDVCDAKVSAYFGGTGHYLMKPVWMYYQLLILIMICFENCI